MLNNKNISDILLDNFELQLNVSELDSVFKKVIGVEEWEMIRQDAIDCKNETCQGCKLKASNRDRDFLELHVVSGDLSDLESIKFAVLCKTCHTLQHIDVASEKNWIKLVNSIYNQKELISICRAGPSFLMNKIKLREVLILKNEPSSYAKAIKESEFNKRIQTKAVFGKEFPKDRLI